MVQSLSFRRLRWRLRGAWQWPVFGLLFVVDAVIVEHLPFHGEGPDTAGALLLSGFFNLVAVALGAPFVGMLLRRRRPDLPKLIARDYAGTALLAAVTLALLFGGLRHRSWLHAEARTRVAVMTATHDYVLSSAPRFKSGLMAQDLLRETPDLYRACVYGGDAKPLCLFVNTSQSPPGVTLDPSREANRHN
jgi:hypothetical protein